MNTIIINGKRFDTTSTKDTTASEIKELQKQLEGLTSRVDELESNLTALVNDYYDDEEEEEEEEEETPEEEADPISEFLDCFSEDDYSKVAQVMKALGIKGFENSTGNSIKDQISNDLNTLLFGKKSSEEPKEDSNKCPEEPPVATKGHCVEKVHSYKYAQPSSETPHLSVDEAIEKLKAERAGDTTYPTNRAYLKALEDLAALIK